MILGNPLFGWIIIGLSVDKLILLTISNNSLGPNEQLTPKASTSRFVKVFATISGVEPVKVLPVLSNVIVANIGKFVFSFKANIQAFISYKSENVSRIYPSTKSFVINAISLNAS